MIDDLRTLLRVAALSVGAGFIGALVVAAVVYLALV